MKRISIVVPLFNEATVLHELYARLTAVFEPLPYEAEFMFVNDGSTDDSATIVEALAASNPLVRYIELSRNFGKEIATSAGIIESTGDAVIMIDADLQHPPERIPDFIAAWEQGSEVVVGVRRPRQGEGMFRRIGSRGFSSVMNAIADTHAPAGATDFRLIDRAVVDAFRTLKERRRLTRSLIDWLGFRRTYLEFDANERSGGAPRYNYFKLIGSAFSAIIAHSNIPLLAAGYMGAVITLLSGMLGLFIIVEQVILGDPWGIDVTGTAMLGVLIVFLNGIALVCLGLVALYIGTIHEDTAARPLYVARRRIG